MNFREYSPEELQRISRRAGIASGKARRKKRKAIERAKVKDAALRELHRENVESVRTAAKLLLECKRTLQRRGAFDEYY